MSLAIVDGGGHLVLLVRMDGAGWLTTDIARGKAYTACAFRRPTSELAERMANHPSFLNAINAVQPGVMAVGGGVPAVREGRVIGGIGARGTHPKGWVGDGRPGRGMRPGRSGRPVGLSGSRILMGTEELKT